MFVHRQNKQREFERFLYWLAPRSRTRCFVGYIKPAGSDPKLIYFDRKAFLVEVDLRQRIEIGSHLNDLNTNSLHARAH